MVCFINLQHTLIVKYELGTIFRVSVVYNKQISYSAVVSLHLQVRRRRHIAIFRSGKSRNKKCFSPFPDVQPYAAQDEGIMKNYY